PSCRSRLVSFRPPASTEPHTLSLHDALPILTGRHGFFSCYEAFIHIVDSMFNQHAKWLQAMQHIPWRAPIASLNILLTSHVWRQDRKSTRLNSSHVKTSYAVFCLKKKTINIR